MRDGNLGIFNAYSQYLANFYVAQLCVVYHAGIRFRFRLVYIMSPSCTTTRFTPIPFRGARC